MRSVVTASSGNEEVTKHEMTQKKTRRKHVDDDDGDSQEEDGEHAQKENWEKLKQVRQQVAQHQTGEQNQMKMRMHLLLSLFHCLKLWK